VWDHITYMDGLRTQDVENTRGGNIWQRRAQRRWKQISEPDVSRDEPVAVVGIMVIAPRPCNRQGKLEIRYDGVLRPVEDE